MQRYDDDSVFVSDEVSLIEHVNSNNNAKSKSYFSITSLVVVLALIGSVALFVDQDDVLNFIDAELGSFKKSKTSSTSAQPNIILLVADDLGYNSIGYQQFDMADFSPNLNAYASSGIILDNYYAQEVCSPSRAALLTGRYPLSIGMQYGVVDTANSWGLNLNETTLAEVLSDSGYKTHIIGKWHLGHCNPHYLPSARGFDTFTGFLDGSEYYWSKHSETENHLTDFLTMDKDCYYAYDGEQKHNYSTWLYRDIAKQIIVEHDQTNPLFLYIAFQAVHSPFIDSDEYANGIPEWYVGEKVSKVIASTVVGERREQFARALYILDSSIKEIVEELDATDMLDNSYVIFMSDNGGCKYGGGKNGPFRGMKASLFEGGSKVDSFIYSPSFYTESSGTIYKNLFHVSDWFCTILDMANIVFTAGDNYELDGVSHHNNFETAKVDEQPPREYMLYNSYYKVEGYDFDKWHNGPFAVRDGRYKLIHTYNSTIYGAWNQFDEESEDDDGIKSTNMDCKQSSAIDEDEESFFYGLYDLWEDPYEINNLWNSTDNDEVNTVRETLYELIDIYEGNAKVNIDNWEKLDDRIAKTVWVSECSAHICPWVSAESDVVKSKFKDLESKSYPSNCGSSTEFASSR